MNSLTPASPPMQCLVILNGGVENNVSRGRLLAWCRRFGDVRRLLMPTRRAYAWVRYAEVDGARRASTASRCSAHDDDDEDMKTMQTSANTKLRFYIFYVESRWSPVASGYPNGCSMESYWYTQ